jgi:hypothetical protein
VSADFFDFYLMAAGQIAQQCSLSAVLLWQQRRNAV